MYRNDRCTPADHIGLCQQFFFLLRIRQKIHIRILCYISLSVRPRRDPRRAVDHSIQKSPVYHPVRISLLLRRDRAQHHSLRRFRYDLDPVLFHKRIPALRMRHRPCTVLLSVFRSVPTLFHLFSPSCAPASFPASHSSCPICGCIAAAPPAAPVRQIPYYKAVLPYHRNGLPYLPPALPR